MLLKGSIRYVLKLTIGFRKIEVTSTRKVLKNRSRKKGLFIVD